MYEVSPLTITKAINLSTAPLACVALDCIMHAHIYHTNNIKLTKHRKRHQRIENLHVVLVTVARKLVL